MRRTLGGGSVPVPFPRPPHHTALHGALRGAIFAYLWHHLWAADTPKWARM